MGGLRARHRLLPHVRLRSTAVLTSSFEGHKEAVIRSTRPVAYRSWKMMELRQITPDCELYTQSIRDLPEDWPLPWWGFVWPGGYAITHAVYSEPSLVRNRRVIDFACGCGSASIASVWSGAREVLANDICHVAVAATSVNASINGVRAGFGSGHAIRLLPDDIIGSDIGRFVQPGDVMIAGDTLYDGGIASRIIPWMQALAKHGVDVYIGDPKRWVLQEMSSSKRREVFEHCFDVDLPEEISRENHGFTSAAVLKLRR
jgi:predicted nicotinamide N-methyase